MLDFTLNHADIHFKVKHLRDNIRAVGNVYLYFGFRMVAKVACEITNREMIANGKAGADGMPGRLLSKSLLCCAESYPLH
jgi:hypothetical protein